MSPRRHDPPPQLLRAPFGLDLADELISRRQLHHNYAKVFRGGWSTDHGELDLLGRMVALRAAVGPDPVWAGLCAAVLHGADVAGRRSQLELVVPRAHQRRSRPGVRVRGMALGPGDVEDSPYGRVLSPVRTALDLATRPPSPLAVARLDQVLRAGSVPLADLERAIGARPGARGIRWARAALELAEPLSESIPESLLRLALVDLGLPRPEAQLTVLDAQGRFVARLDLGWRDARVGVEYDGAHHRESGRHSLDLNRHNRLRSLGWTVYQVDQAGARQLGPLTEAIRRQLG